MQQLYDVNSAAQLLAVSSWTIRALIRQGKMNPTRIGRLVRIDAGEIQRFIERAKVNVAEAQKSNQEGAAQ
jgi:excisionase family DNA binding protein